jgi:tetratricopeptide (TPR) repeat protein
MLMLAVLSLHQTARADELKDISQLASQGQQAAALSRINSYIATNPKDVQALFMRGVFLAESGKRDEAIKAFTDLTERYPGLPEPYNNLAVLYADQGQYEKARKALESAIKTHPSYATAHENLGDIYARMASEAYDKALQLDTGNARAQNKLSLIRDLFNTTNASAKPTVIASKTPETKTAETKVPEPVTREPEKPAPATVDAKPVEPPAKPAEIKPAELAKPAPANPPTVADTGNDEKSVSSAVDQWAKAWSGKNVSQYLASYADHFQTPGGESRQNWESTRKDRISKPASISVEVSNLRVRLESPSKARASFNQSYRADSLIRRTSKTLVMEKIKGNWLITQELTDR